MGNRKKTVDSVVAAILAGDAIRRNERRISDRLLYGLPVHQECPICGGLPPGEASGAIDVCTCDRGVDAELPGRSPLETVKDADHA